MITTTATPYACMAARASFPQSGNVSTSWTLTSLGMSRRGRPCASCSTTSVPPSPVPPPGEYARDPAGSRRCARRRSGSSGRPLTLTAMATSPSPSSWSGLPRRLSLTPTCTCRNPSASSARRAVQACTPCTARSRAALARPSRPRWRARGSAPAASTDAASTPPRGATRSSRCCPPAGPPAWTPSRRRTSQARGSSSAAVPTSRPSCSKS
mmetsp:Transcript_97537/g.303800  ORF Transcript_97537/g.303800 Transcript_97537/m.303800 type:complete len:211 (-) Transcript_97537:731-1363(-)